MERGDLTGWRLRWSLRWKNVNLGIGIGIGFVLYVKKSMIFLMVPWQFDMSSNMNTTTLAAVKQTHTARTPVIWSSNSGRGSTRSLSNGCFLKFFAHWTIKPLDEYKFSCWLKGLSKNECFRKYMQNGMAWMYCLVFKIWMFGKCKRLK